MDEDEAIELRYEDEVVITADEDLDDPFSDRTSARLTNFVFLGCITLTAAIHLNPGGYAEFTEATIIPQSDDGTLPQDSVIAKTATLVVEAGRAVGRKVMEMPQVRDALLRAGFVDVRVSQYKWPINTWPRDHKYKDIGMWAHENVVSGWEGLCMATLTRIYGAGRCRALSKGADG